MKSPSWRVLSKDLRFAAGVLQKKPFNCLVQVTNRCNMKCSFCDFWPNPARPGEELTLGELQRIASELRRLGCFLVSIEGGEPLVRRDLEEIVAALSEHHITALFTSGWYVTAARARALWDAGLTHASVSIDYPDAARHDDKRRITGTTDRAWRAVEILRDTAPRGGKQVNVMSVLMESNRTAMDALFSASAAKGVGHQVTLLSTAGTRRGTSGADRLPLPGISPEMTALFDRHRHVRFFREYFERLDAFLEGGPMPACRAGLQSFNIDHVGNVSSCIERIGKPVGNIRTESLPAIHRRLSGPTEQAEVSACQACWTACRGFQQSMGAGGALRSWRDLTLRTRTE